MHGRTTLDSVQVTGHDVILSGDATSNVIVALAADDNYVRPLAVAARSVIANLDSSRSLTCCILDMGIKPAHRRALTETLSHPSVEVIWETSLREHVLHLPETWATITRATYARLYLPQILPHAERVLYLDSDVMARRCAGDLFMSDMNGHAALAVPDTQAPFVSSPNGVPWWHDRGRGAGELNFNAGVFLIDLAQWRETDVTREALAYLTDGRHHFVQDQEALNSVLPGRIAEVDPRWNQQAELFQARWEVIAPYSSEVVEQVKRDPWIVHFSNYPKPWIPWYDPHPFADEWYAYLDETPFAGWRPPVRAHVTTLARRGTRRVAQHLGLVKHA